MKTVVSHSKAIFLFLFSHSLFVGFLPLQCSQGSGPENKQRLSPEVRAHYEELLQKYTADPFHEKNLKNLQYHKNSLKNLPESPALSRILSVLDKRINVKESVEILSPLLHRPVAVAQVLDTVINLSENLEFLDQEDKEIVGKVGASKQFTDKYIKSPWKQRLIGEEEKNNKGLSGKFEKYRVDYKTKLEPFKQACTRISTTVNFPVPLS